MWQFIWAEGNAWHDIEKLIRKVAGEMAIADLAGLRRANRDHEHRCGFRRGVGRKVDYVEETVPFERSRKCVCSR